MIICTTAIKLFTKLPYFTNLSKCKNMMALCWLRYQVFVENERIKVALSLKCCACKYCVASKAFSIDYSITDGDVDINLAQPHILNEHAQFPPCSKTKWNMICSSYYVIKQKCLDLAFRSYEQTVLGGSSGYLNGKYPKTNETSKVVYFPR